MKHPRKSKHRTTMSNHPAPGFIQIGAHTVNLAQVRYVLWTNKEGAIIYFGGHEDRLVLPKEEGRAFRSWLEDNTHILLPYTDPEDK